MKTHRSPGRSRSRMAMTAPMRAPSIPPVCHWVRSGKARER